MAEKVYTFLFANAGEKRSDLAPETWNGSFRRFSQERLDFAED
jgi:hypothetical protein